MHPSAGSEKKPLDIIANIYNALKGSGLISFLVKRFLYLDIFFIFSCHSIIMECRYIFSTCFFFHFSFVVVLIQIEYNYNVNDIRVFSYRFCCHLPVRIELHKQKTVLI